MIKIFAESSRPKKSGFFLRFMHPLVLYTDGAVEADCSSFGAVLLRARFDSQA